MKCSSEQVNLLSPQIALVWFPRTKPTFSHPWRFMQDPDAQDCLDLQVLEQLALCAHCPRSLHSCLSRLMLGLRLALSFQLSVGCLLA